MRNQPESDNAAVGGFFTEGGDFVFYNYTPFDFVLTDSPGRKSYQVSWNFPDYFPAGQGTKSHIEWQLWCNTNDSRASATYKATVEGIERRISFRGDKDSGRFNIWVDLNYDLGSLPMDDGTSRVDCGWTENGTRSFALYYDKETGKFMLKNPNPIPHNGTAENGYYDLDWASSLQHTYAVMRQKKDNMEVRFHCYGGTNGNNKVYPAPFCNQDGSVSGNSKAIHPAVARAIAAWDKTINWSRSNYDKKSGGSLGLGDCSGLVYAIEGVCHQMCNSILCATAADQPLSACVNWPPSYRISKLLYGVRGGGSTHDKALMEIATAALRLDGTPFSEIWFQSEIEIQSRLIAEDVKKQLRGDDIKERRLETLYAVLPSIVEAESAIHLLRFNVNALDFDFNFATEKNRLDNLLIRGEIANKEYAKEINEDFWHVYKKYAELFSDSGFTPLESSENIDLIDPEAIPDYSEFCKKFGI